MSSSRRGRLREAHPMSPPVTLICPEHRVPIAVADTGKEYRCPRGCEFPIVRGIPRFVPAENYAAGFGLQWNTVRRTQLDTHTGTTISRDRLRRIAGGDLGLVRGKSVLEAGCGAGRFTEILLAHGARVFATDLSSAVEANWVNFNEQSKDSYFVCQADVTKLPAPPGAFDVVVCVGVVQHTPDPERTMTALCGHLRPGGVLLIDHYSPGYPATATRRALRRFLLGRDPESALRFCRFLVAVLWPAHRLSYALRRLPGFARLRHWFLLLSPVVDYQDAYSVLDPRLLYEWAVLDTHDTLTDRYKHLRSAEQIRAHLTTCGMESIKTAYAGNGVEARAIKSALAAATG